MSIVKVVVFNKQEYILNKKQKIIETELDPTGFSWVNGQYILNKRWIDKLKFYFNGKLIVNAHLVTTETIIVSELKVG
jgi:DNA-binding LytR/AlgR family response regulator